MSISPYHFCREVEKVYCTERLWHAPWSADPGARIGEGTVALSQPQQGLRSAKFRGGYVSEDGHVFPCTHSNTVPYHVVFIINKSKSMQKEDIKPQHPHVSAVQNNRLGCVYESMIRFIRLRKCLGVRKDYMSLVLFDDEAFAPVQLQGLYEQQVMCALKHNPRYGTNFCAALEVAGQVVARGQTSRNACTAPPVIIFLSDGGSGCGDPLAKARELQQRFPSLTIHTIKFGRDMTHQSVLPSMATIGHGQYSESLDDVQLARTFERLATSLRPNFSAFM